MSLPDEETGRYRGLRGGQLIALLDVDSAGLLVKSDVTRGHLDAKEDESGEPPRPVDGDGTAGTQDETGPVPPTPVKEPPTRFHGSVSLDATRAGRIAEEVITHLAGLVGAKVKVTLEIEAQIPDGAPDQVVGAVTENSRTLKFNSHGFERESPGRTAACAQPARPAACPVSPAWAPPGLKAARSVRLSVRGDSVLRLWPSPNTLHEVEPFPICWVLEHILRIFLFVCRRVRQAVSQPHRFEWTRV